MTPSPSRRRRAGILLILALCLPLVSASLPTSETSHDPLTGFGWVWPVTPVRIVRGWEAPSHPYGPGHRGIDLAATEVRAPAEGVVAFVGPVAGRGVLTIDHGGGLVTSVEPVVSDLRVGERVSRGQQIGLVAEGGHAPPATVHVGVRLNGEYINPLRLLGGVPRAVLLPCC